jgi:signal transduction histidine kinase
VEDLLDVSRITSGKIELDRTQIEMADVITNAVEMCSPLFEEKRHKLVMDVPQSGLPVLGDATRLGQIVSNLLTNAAKYTPPGGTVTVRAAREQDYIVVRIRDTGIGIAPDALRRIFDLFVQERTARERADGGLGAGSGIGQRYAVLLGAVSLCHITKDHHDTGDSPSDVRIGAALSSTGISRPSLEMSTV